MCRKSWLIPADSYTTTEHFLFFFSPPEEQQKIHYKYYGEEYQVLFLSEFIQILTLILSHG